MKRMKTILALGAFFVLAVALAACGSSSSSSSAAAPQVAAVAGNPITVQAFKHWMFVAAKGQSAQSPGSPVIVPSDPPSFAKCIAEVKTQIPSLAKRSNAELQSDCKQLFTSLSSQVMDFLIRAYWYQAEAAKLGITVTNAQINTAFASAKKQQFPTATAFSTFLTQSGQTLQDILFRVRVNQIYMKLLARHQVTATPAQISAYYASHTSQFGTPEKRDIRLVRTNKAADASTALAALKHGQSWTTVAKKYSVDATKSKGGLLAGVTKGQEEKALDSAAFAAPLNKVQGIIHGQFGYYVFEVVKITKATKQTLTQATPLIKQILTGQSQSKAQTAVDAQAKADWLSKTSCGSLYSMSDCYGYKAPKTTTTTTAPTTTPTPTTPTTTTPTSSSTTAPATTSTTSTGTTSTTTSTTK